MSIFFLYNMNLYYVVGKIILTVQKSINNLYVIHSL